MSVALVLEVRLSARQLQQLTNDGIVGRGGPSQRCMPTSTYYLNYNDNSP